MKFFKTAIPILFLLSCASQNKLKNTASTNDNNSLLWEISGNGLSKPSYLFGTFHLMCKEDINFSETLKQSIKNTDDVYFEIDLDDPANTVGAMALMAMKNGKTLKNIYTADEYKRVDKFFKDSVHTSLAMLQTLKPNFLEAFLYPSMMPCKKMSGVENELMLLAKENKKEIKGFETMAFQASVFDSIPYETQAKNLLKTIDSIAIYKKYFTAMLDTYKTQKLSNIEKMLNNTEFGVEENKDVLLNNRNKNWVLQLKDILKQRSVFIAVGTGHLVGDLGLITLLRNEGYTVKPIAN